MSWSSKSQSPLLLLSALFLSSICLSHHLDFILTQLIMPAVKQSTPTSSTPQWRSSSDNDNASSTSPVDKTTKSKGNSKSPQGQKRKTRDNDDDEPAGKVASQTYPFKSILADEIPRLLDLGSKPKRRSTLSCSKESLRNIYGKRSKRTRDLNIGGIQVSGLILLLWWIFRDIYIIIRDQANWQMKKLAK